MKDDLALPPVEAPAARSADKRSLPEPFYGLARRDGGTDRAGPWYSAEQVVEYAAAFRDVAFEEAAVAVQGYLSVAMKSGAFKCEDVCIGAVALIRSLKEPQ
jgi:hypothetical protein